MCSVKTDRLFWSEPSDGDKPFPQVGNKTDRLYLPSFEAYSLSPRILQ